MAAKMEQPLLFIHIKQKEHFAIFDTKWIPNTVKFVSIGGKTNGTGLIKVFELNGNNIDVVREINRKDTFKCAAFGLSRSQNAYLAIGDFGGSLQIIDVNRMDGGIYMVPKAHRGFINAIDTAGNIDNKGPSEIVTGGNDGLVKVWDPRCTEAVIQIEPTINNASGARDCWAVAFGDSHNNDERSVCAGFDNGDIRLFDLRTLQVRWETNVRNGVCDLQTNNKYEPLHKIVATTTNGCYNLLEFNGGPNDIAVTCISKTDADEQPSIHPGHDNRSKENPTVWRVRHLPQNPNIFATCGGSGNLRIWHCKVQSVKLSPNLKQMVDKIAIETSKKELHSAMTELDKDYAYFRMNPTEHPMYTKEWHIFYLRTLSELCAANVDPDSYDFTRNWSEFWPKRIDFYYHEALRDIIDDIAVGFRTTLAKDRFDKYCEEERSPEKRTPDSSSCLMSVDIDSATDASESDSDSESVDGLTSILRNPPPEILNSIVSSIEPVRNQTINPSKNTVSSIPDPEYSKEDEEKIANDVVALFKSIELNANNLPEQQVIGFITMIMQTKYPLKQVPLVQN